jgi:hypothetical protein
MTCCSLMADFKFESLLIRVVECVHHGECRQPISLHLLSVMRDRRVALALVQRRLLRLQRGEGAEAKSQVDAMLLGLHTIARMSTAQRGGSAHAHTMGSTTDRITRASEL